MAIEDFYTSLDIDKVTTTGSGDVRSTSTWTAVSGDHIGFIQPVSGSESFRDGRAGEAVTARMYCPVDTPGEYLYRVTQNSVTYSMLYTIQPQGISSVSHHKEILLGDFE
jgi:hypothetical protein